MACVFSADVLSHYAAQVAGYSEGLSGRGRESNKGSVELMPPSGLHRCVLKVDVLHASIWKANQHS